MILVTGANGHLGSRILHHIRELGADVRGGSRTPDADGMLIDFDRPSTLDLRGVSTLVLVSAGYAEDDSVVARHGNVLDAAKRDGVNHVIYTSLAAEGDHLAFALAHRATERMIMESGIGWTILRNGLYAELIGGLVIWDEERILSPFGSGAVAAATRENLAEAAARVAVAAHQHIGRTYDLTGPAFTLADVALRLGAPVVEISLADYRDRLLATPGLFAFQPPMLASIATSIRHGFLATHHPDLGELLARNPDSGIEAAVIAAEENRGS